MHISKMGDVCHRLKIHIGIIAVPAGSAQEVCDQMVEAGILAIWNFAPVHLTVPDHVVVQNVNLATSLVILMKRMAEKLAEKEEF